MDDESHMTAERAVAGELYAAAISASVNDIAALWMRNSVRDILRRHWHSLKSSRGEPSAVLCDELLAAAATHLMFPDAVELERQRLAREGRVAAILDQGLRAIPGPSTAQVRAAVHERMVMTTDKVPTSATVAER